MLLGTGKTAKLLQSYDTDGAAGNGTGPGVSDLLTLEEAYNSGTAIFNFTYTIFPEDGLTSAPMAVPTLVPTPVSTSSQVNSDSSSGSRTSWPRWCGIVVAAVVGIVVGQ